MKRKLLESQHKMLLDLIKVMALIIMKNNKSLRTGKFEDTQAH